MAPQPAKIDNRPGNPNIPPGNHTRARETVTVYCKEHVAWLDLQLCKEQTVVQQGQNGPKDVTMFYKTGPIVRIRGLSYPVGVVPEGYHDRPEKVLGYAITRNIDKEWWDQFAEQYAKWPPLMSGMVFARADDAEGRAFAKDHRGLVSAFTPLNPKGDPRAPRPISEGIDPIETEERRAKKMVARPETPAEA